MEDNSLEKSLKLLKNCPELESLERKLKQFNVFEVLRLGDQESCHSNFLAWLLDPHQNHGLAKSFLKKWLKEVFKTSDSADPLELDEYSFEPV
jgi:PD-(D/E)XK nuclease superfamily